MLVGTTARLIKTPFRDEAEIEEVVQKYAQYLFGSSIIYLPKGKIATVGGRGTIPDGFVIDVQSEEWFIVEAERAIHGTWEHIAPQVSKQLAAVETAETREAILKLALQQLKGDKKLKEIFTELGIDELGIHGKLQTILRKPPTIAIPNFIAALCIWLLIVSTILLSEFSGSIMHEKKKAGSTPKVATSLALTFIASHPTRSTAPVMGSIETIAFLFPKSKTAPSTPAAGPKVTSLRG